jgi:hypothetical protein
MALLLIYFFEKDKPSMPPWIQVHHTACIDNERAVSIRINPQMNARLLLFGLADVVIESRFW